MNCADVAENVKLWSEARDRTIGEETIVELRAHLVSCPSCGKKYGPLRMFMERDAGIAARTNDPFFTARMMDRIRSESAEPKRKAVFSGNRFAPLLAAALALIVFSAGFAARGLLRPAVEDTVECHFVFNAPEASSVHLVGSFPDWSVDESRAMRLNTGGQWVLTLDLKKDGVYSYSFLVDGTVWVPDPAAEEVVDDGFGGVNSLLRI